MRSIIHALVASGPVAKRPILITIIAKPRVICEISIIMSTTIVKHWTLPNVQMGTLLLFMQVKK